MSQDTIIIGGGISGLSAAYELLRHGIKPLIIEKEPFLGGMASCRQVDGFRIERFYHHFFSHDFELLGIIKELRTEDELIWNKSKMGFLSADNRLHNFTSPADLLRFDEIGLLDRLKFGLLSVFSKGKADYERLDELSVEEWVNNKIGSSVYEKIISPLIKSKFGMEMDEVSAAFLMGRFEARIRSRNKIIGDERFGYYKGGMQNFISLLYGKILSLGGTFKLNTAVKSIVVKKDFNFEIKTENESFHCSRLIVTVPAPVLAKMLAEPNSIGHILPHFNYRSAVCLCLGAKEKLSDYYWINVASGEVPFGVIVEHTNLVPASFYNGMSIIYLSNYCDGESPLYGMKDDEIFEHYIKGLKKIPCFSIDRVAWFRVSRELFATPVFKKNYYKLMHQLKNSLPNGLYIIGNILAYPGSRNINTAIRIARDTINGMLSDDEIR